MRHPLWIPLAVLIGLILLSGIGLKQRDSNTTTILTPLQTKLRALYAADWIDGDERATLEALTLGYRDELSKTLKRQFSAAGAMHVLAVSGLHTGILYGIVVWILTGGGRWKPRYEERWKQVACTTIGVGLMWGYALMTGLSPSVTRSVVMVSVMAIGQACRRDGIGLNSLYAAAFIILLFRPYELYSIGFWMSCLAVWSILAFKPTNLVTMSLIAQLGTLPLCLHTFGQISNYFLPTSLIAIPLATIIMWTAVLYFAVCWLPLTSLIMGKALAGMAWLLNHSVGFIESLPGSTTEIRISTIEMGCLYSAIVFGAMVVRRKRLIYLIPTSISVAAFMIFYLWIPRY